MGTVGDSGRGITRDLWRSAGAHVCALSCSRSPGATPVLIPIGDQVSISVWVSAEISTRISTHSGADPKREEAPRSRSAFREDALAAKSKPASAHALAVRHSLLPTRKARMRWRARARSCAHTQTHAESSAVCLVRLCVHTRMGKGSGKGAGRGGERESRCERMHAPNMCMLYLRSHRTCTLGLVCLLMRVLAPVDPRTLARAH